MSSSKRVAVAMSGGVDSSTAVVLLQREGYDVIGITAVMHEVENAQALVSGAENVAKTLGIKHFAIDLRDEFKEKVINYFECSYEKGLTPNPCAVCNKSIKWGKLWGYAQEKLGADFYATGHYARIIKGQDNYKLLKSLDSKKDQTYMLFDLTQDDLSHTLFPLGPLAKSEVRKIAAENNLPCAQSKESQDVCFILPPDTTSKYLKGKFSEQEGNIIDFKTQKVLGKHKGYYNYTIGQRKGIGIAAIEPLYVVSIDAANNVVYVGFKEDLAENDLEIKNINWQQPEWNKSEFKALVKIRYNTQSKVATVNPSSDNKAVISFDKPEYGITPGQIAVFYDLNNEYLIGGGWII